MKKLTLSILLISCSIGLSACSSSSDMSDAVWTSFGEIYELQIPLEFENINPKLVENKEITNRVLLSYKKENEDVFDDNIVVTLSEVGPSLDYEQFWTVNSKRLQTSLAGYIPGEQKRVSFECDGEEINGLFVTFDVKNTFSDIQELTYLSQYQFVHQDKGYIVSYAGVDAKIRDKSDSRLSNVRCIVQGLPSKQASRYPGEELFLFTTKQASWYSFLEIKFA